MRGVCAPRSHDTLRRWGTVLWQQAPPVPAGHGQQIHRARTPAPIPRGKRTKSASTCARSTTQPLCAFGDPLRAAVHRTCDLPSTTGVPT